MNRALLMDLSERTVVSLVRTAFYLLLAVLVANGRAEEALYLKALVAGAVLADFITWFAKSLMDLPEHLLHGGYDAAVNLLFAIWFFRGADFNLGDDGGLMAAAFLTFTLVMGSKVGWYALEKIRADLEAD
jgi:hypothetical protein